MRRRSWLRQIIPVPLSTEYGVEEGDAIREERCTWWQWHDHVFHVRHTTIFM